MRVLGVDQSYTAFGWSLHTDDKHVTKKKGFPANRYDSDTDRLSHIRDWFTILLEEGHPDLVVMEGYAAASKYGRESAGELGAVVKLTVKDVNGSDTIIVPPTRLKKFVTGKGNAKKNEMLLAVYKRWGEEFTDDNEADAFALAKLGLALLGLDNDSMTKPQCEVVEEIRKAVGPIN